MGLSLTKHAVRAIVHRRESLKAAFFSCRGSQELLHHLKTTPNGIAGAESRVSSLENLINEQSRINIQDLYRMCAGVTMFESSDPNSSAVDDGRIVGVRIEAFSQRLYSLCCTIIRQTTNEARPNIKKLAPFSSPTTFS